MSEHCGDNKGDRKVGARWERNFCVMAAEIGLMFTPLQIGRKDSALAWTREGSTWNSLTLPDVTIWTAPGQHHEIKHKNPTPSNCFGLEVYRFEKLMRFHEETQQDVYYTIHNWEQAPGGRDGVDNRMQDWVVASVDTLQKALDNGNAELSRRFPSYINGQRHDNVPIYFWPIDLWSPLTGLWTTTILNGLW